MIEEQGRVIDVTSAGVWVQTVKASTCSGCKAKKGCGHHLLAAGRGSGQAAHIYVSCDRPLRVGDQVVLGISEQALLKAALWVYGLPLLLLFAGAAVGHWLAPGGGDSSLWGGLAGLLAGFAVNRWRAAKGDCDITIIDVSHPVATLPSDRIAMSADEQG